MREGVNGRCFKPVQKQIFDIRSFICSYKPVGNHHHHRRHRQVSNAGVTSLCEKCPLLAHLGMSSLKHVTDIGVARLGAGCTRLTYLDMSGFVNLSDGMQRDFAFTGVQVRVWFFMLPVQIYQLYRAWLLATVPT